MKPAWLEIAEGELDQAEVSGVGSNPRIIEYHATTTLKATDDRVPWCSSFVNWCLYHAGVMPTRSAAARSFLRWGVVCEPVEGCIVVFRRGASETAGHVAFYVATVGDRVRVLGGNQSDKVCYATYRAADVLGYRWPT